MSLCALCGLTVMRSVEAGVEGFCDHHPTYFPDDWSAGNRIMCNFFHRKELPVRLTTAEREDDFWANSEASGC